MALAPGTRVGPYEIIAPIGAGGMGEVYRARDTKLNRDVALKILPDAFAIDGDRIARFRREAQVLASLNHPNIAAIYGFEDSSSAHALVLELVEGPTLADRIAKGPIPLDEALPIAKQIAEALEAAHEHGIIHRDLKPANIKLRDDGAVKVLDFGLAKAMEPISAISPGLTASPTITTPAMMTGVGMILGTAAYMSPEQAKGRPADKRSDIWAFGCVLYEMLTAERAFEGEDVSDTLAAVLRSEPDWSALPTETPSPIRSLIRRCLQKDVQKRLPHIGVARLEIEQPSDMPSGSIASGQERARPIWRRALPAVIATVVTAALVGAASWHFGPEVLTPIVTRFPIILPDGQTFTNAGRQMVAISPDGTQLVYVANQRLYLRAMSELDARPIAGVGTSAVLTSGVANPVFSPDGRSIAFWNTGDRSLKRIAVTGGTPVTIGPFPTPFGMSWGPDGIVFGDAGRGIVRVSPNGGAPEVLVAVHGNELAHGPQMLPGGKAVLFTLTTSDRAGDRWDKADIVVQTIASSERKTLVRGGSDARYVPTGHLVYAVSGVVFAVPLDLPRLQVTGSPVPVMEGVRRANGQPGATGTAQFSVAANGSLVYIPGPVAADSGSRELAIVDRTGSAEALKVPAGTLEHPRISPGGKQVVFDTDDEKETVVWTYDLSGAIAMHRVTFAGRNRFPIWTNDGQRVAFQSDRDGDLGIFWQRVDGTGPAERLTTAEKETAHIPESWSPLGDGFLFRITKGGVNTLAYYSFRDKKTETFGKVQSTTPTNATFSPDGRWVAYEQSDGRGDHRIVYVQPFPATSATYELPVVEGGGYRHPRWSPDGKGLFYMIGGNVRFWLTSVTTAPVFAFGNPTPVVKPSFWLDGFNDAARQWDVLPDGQHFIARVEAGTAGQKGSVPQIQEIQVVLHWFEELKQRVPSK